MNSRKKYEQKYYELFEGGQAFFSVFCIFVDWRLEKSERNNKICDYVFMFNVVPVVMFRNGMNLV